jgi:oligopeptidase B
MGKNWHDGGRMLNKKNTFTDFIAAAEYLIDRGFTSNDRLIIGGGSAGGLLIGAVLNLRPELCRAAIAKVPFVDLVHTMLDPSLPLTVTEYEEWGNPQEERAFHYMRSYSPYDNIAPTSYPHLLVTAGLHDPRVAYWEPAKWVARLRQTRTNESLLLLKTDLTAGHSGPSSRYLKWRELAFEYAFIQKALKLD